MASTVRVGTDREAHASTSLWGVDDFMHPPLAGKECGAPAIFVTASMYIDTRRLAWHETYPIKRAGRKSRDCLSTALYYLVSLNWLLVDSKNNGQVYPSPPASSRSIRGTKRPMLSSREAFQMSAWPRVSRWVRMKPRIYTST